MWRPRWIPCLHSQQSQDWILNFKPQIVSLGMHQSCFIWGSMLALTGTKNMGVHFLHDSSMADVPLVPTIPACMLLGCWSHTGLLVPCGCAMTTSIFRGPCNYPSGQWENRIPYCMAI